MTRIVLLEGDIAEQRVDAIVNAANSSLRLGTGVAGAIAQRGGPAIQEECSVHGAIEVGEAAVTGAGEMDAKFVIHAAGMPLGGQVTEDSLRLTLKAALARADEKGCETIALPAIGAGVGGLSLQTCAEISLKEARAYAEAQTIAGSTGLQEIRFVLLGEPSFRLFEMVNDSAKVEEQMRKLRNR